MARLDNIWLHPRDTQSVRDKLADLNNRPTEASLEYLVELARPRSNRGVDFRFPGIDRFSSDPL